MLEQLALCAFTNAYSLLKKNGKIKDVDMYIYIWGHYLLIAWFLYRRDLKVIGPSKKFMPLKNFQAAIASSLVTLVKRKARRASLDAIPIPTKRAAAVQSNPRKISVWMDLTTYQLIVTNGKGVRNAKLVFLIFVAKSAIFGCA